MLGQTDYVDSVGGCNVGVSVCKHVKLAAARTHFLNVRFQLFEERVVGGHGNDRHLISNERERAVLQLAGGIGLRVNVRDFLELECALESNGKMTAAPEEQGVILLRELFGPPDDLRLQCKHALQGDR